MPDPNPFVGLRPFEEEDSEVFFGRLEHSKALIERLDVSRFAAVIGTSGSGKSSLVKAGLLPRLRAGRMLGAGGEWRIAVLRPEGQPIPRLADSIFRALHGKRARDPLSNDDKDEIQGLESEISANPEGLADAIRTRIAQAENAAPGTLPASASLLIVVDQFEELFRFGEKDPDDDPTPGSPREDPKVRKERVEKESEAQAFAIRLLVAAGKRTGWTDAGKSLEDEQHKQTKPAAILPVYVLITMRSEFLGDCTRVRGLPEAINEGFYLMPRLNERELRSSIENPLEVRGGSISENLVDRLIDEVCTEQDQLPVLQHALMRTWHGEAEITDEDYDKVGSTRSALSLHANEVLEALDQQGLRPIAERLFRLLTKPGPIDGLRRPHRFGEKRLGDTREPGICEIVDAEPDELKRVMKPFRECSFLMPPKDDDITEESVIDISHESLIRKWDTLKEWIKHETRSGEAYRSLLQQQREGRLLSQGELDIYRSIAENNWSKPWSDRYGGKYDAVIEHIAASERKISNAWRRKVLVAVVLALVVAALIYQQVYARGEASVAASIAMHLAEEQRSDSDAAFAYIAYALRENRDVWPQAKVLIQGLLDYGQHSIQIFPHPQAVRSAAYSASGEEVVTAADDGQVLLWNRKNETSVIILKHKKAVTHVEFSQNDRFVLTTSDDGNAGLWQRGQKPQYLQGWTDSPETPPLNSARFSRDGKLLVTASADGTVKIWETATGKLLGQRKGPNTVFEAVFDEERKIGIAGSDGVAVWEMRPKGLTEIWRQDTPLQAWFAVRFSGFGNVAFAKYDGTTHLFDAKTLKEKGKLLCAVAKRENGPSPPARVLEFSPDGRWLVMGYQSGHVCMADVKSAANSAGEIVSHSMPFDLADGDSKEPVHGGQVSDARFYTGKTNRSPDEPSLITAGADGTAIAWQIVSAKNGDTTGVRKFGPPWRHRDAIYSITFSNNGENVLTASADHTARIWHIHSETSASPKNARFQPSSLQLDDTIQYADLSRDGRRALVALRRNKGAQVFNVPELVSPITFGEGRKFNCITLSPDNMRAVTCEDGNMAQLWNWMGKSYEMAGKPFTHDKIQSSPNDLIGALFVGSGEQLFTASSNGTVEMWKFSSKGEPSRIGPLLAHPGAVNSMEVDPSGRWLLTAAADNFARIWDISTLSGLNKEDSPAPYRALPHNGPVNSATFSPDDKWVLTASDDRTAKVWDFQSGVRVGTLAHDGPVKNAFFSPNGNLIVTASGRAQIWDSKTGLPLGPPILDGREEVTWAKFLPGNNNILLTAGPDYTWRLRDFGVPDDRRGPGPIVRAFPVGLTEDASDKADLLEAASGLMVHYNRSRNPVKKASENFFLTSLDANTLLDLRRAGKEKGQKDTGSLAGRLFLTPEKENPK
jgi:WD40 repeat protein